MDYEDVLYQVDGPVAVVTINRPSRLNAFRARTIEELIHAFKRAWADDAIRAIILTGSGERAFCVGGDVKQRTETGDYGPTSNGLFELTYFHRLIRDVPKPVIAAVNGLAIGGGHVLHVLCDLSIAAEHARFGQAGPRVGSFDGGFGSAYLARVVGRSARARSGSCSISTRPRMPSAGGSSTRWCPATNCWSRPGNGVAPWRATAPPRSAS